MFGQGYYEITLLPLCTTFIDLFSKYYSKTKQNYCLGGYKGSDFEGLL